MVTILHIETSSEWCSVALSKNEQCIDVEISNEKNAQSSLLTIMIDRVLKRNHCSPQTLNAIAVSKGPGSYTGLRIGVSTAKGLAFALELPIISIDTMFCIANAARQQIQEQDNFLIAAVTDARRLEVYAGLFDSTLALVKPIEAILLDPEAFHQYLRNNKIYFAGSGAAKCLEIIQHPHALFIENTNASAEFMVKQAFEKYKMQMFEDIAYFEPFYLKEFYTTSSTK